MQQKTHYALPSFCLRIIFPLSIALIGVPWEKLNAQDSKQQQEIGKEESVKKMIALQRFFFVAQSVTPLSGQTRQLTSEYGMILKKDSLETFLPYFGRAYNAPISTDEGGIKFRSYRFGYVIKETKTGRWEISLQPKDVNEAYHLNLSISKSGYASLEVTSISRQPINFNGYVREINPLKMAE